MDSISRIWIDDHPVPNIQNGSNEPRQLQWNGFMDCVIHERVQNEDGFNYEAGLSYLLGYDAEPIQINALPQPPFIWDGLDHVRLTGREGPAAGRFTHTRQLPNTVPRSLSNSI